MSEASTLGLRCPDRRGQRWNPILARTLAQSLYGAYSVNKRIYLVQGVPAIAAIAALLLLA